MPFELPALPYDRTALEPHLSGDTVDLHHDRIQRRHVERLNLLARDTPFADMPLEEIVRKAQGEMAEHAAQAWAIALYWDGLEPTAAGGSEPDGPLAQALTSAFGSAEGFRHQFGQAALRGFGSGWAWLLQRQDGRLSIAVTPHTVTPLTGTDRVLLACSLWEHAWLLDYREQRAKYLEAFWQLVSWSKVAARMAQAGG